MIEISLIIPSIGRLKFFEDVIRNLKETCSDFSVVEICVKVDNKRQKLLHEEILKNYPFSFQVLNTPETGFQNIYKFQRTLCGAAKGQIIWFMADDRLVGGDWVKAILDVKKQQNNNVYVGNICPGGWSKVPIVTKRWFEIVGIGWCSSTDSWLRNMAQCFGLYIDIPGIKNYNHPEAVYTPRKLFIKSVLAEMKKRQKRNIRKIRKKLQATNVI